ncbi:helix-hairpin-helix domain-containing protein [Frisingicoccus sp.]|jgi:competence protein ComEA|uniref:helix-hairpin-helix domain-containing protein n=1 Tax=Frisingicoccus sp. TaxID=1918627 RepID=UPI0015BD496A
MSKEKIIIAGLIFLLLWGTSACESAGVVMETGEVAGDESVRLTENGEDLIYVYVCGQVKSPGVYVLDEGSRLFEAVDMAGGMLSGGDLSRINLAAVLTDGQKIYIPSEAETLQTGEELLEIPENGDGSLEQRVNINRASKETLMTLPGIGEAKAEAILTYRQAEGRFESPEELMNVPGIKAGIYAKIKDRIAID